MLTSYCRDGGTNCYLHKGGYVGYSQGALSIINSKNSWSGGSYHDGGSKGNYECSMVGAFDTANTLNIQNVYYSTSSYAKANGYLEYQDTKTALFGQEYADSMNNKIGFVDDDLWLCNINLVQQRTLSTPTDIAGCYLDSIAFTNGNEEVYTVVAKPNFNAPATAKIAADKLQSMTNILNGLNYAYYGYVADEQGSASGTYRLYYNNGNYVDYTFPASYNGHRVSIYDVYERRTINNQVYYITKNSNIDYYS